MGNAVEISISGCGGVCRDRIVSPECNPIDPGQGIGPHARGSLCNALDEVHERLLPSPITATSKTMQERVLRSDRGMNPTAYGERIRRTRFDGTAKI